MTAPSFNHSPIQSLIRAPYPRLRFPPHRVGFAVLGVLAIIPRMKTGLLRRSAPLLICCLLLLATSAISLDPSLAQSGTAAVSFEGASLKHGSALGKVSARRIPARVLEDPSEKPDDVKGEHLSFTFEGYPQRKETFFNPVIEIYKLDDFRSAFKASPEYVRGIDRAVRDLKRRIATRNRDTRTEIPYLPFVDASQAFRSRVRLINFGKGKGIAFLTQYNIEPSVINNQGVAYIFQGLTDDGRHYIVATFPIATSILAESFADSSHSAFTLPSSMESSRNKAAYNQYVSRIALKLNNLPGNRFEPDIRLLMRCVVL